MIILQFLDKNDYWKWENNYVHKIVKDLNKLDSYETDNGLPLIVSKREPHGKYGYCNSTGNEVKIIWCVEDDELINFI